VSPDRPRGLQSGVCAICKCKVSDQRNRRKGRPLDGKHRLTSITIGETDKMRGLPCHSCNLGLGKFDHSLVYLGNAIDYLLGRHVEEDDGNVE